MTVTVPDGVSGDVAIRRHVVTRTDARFSAARAAYSFGGFGRSVPEGTYTGLFRGGRLWMSDTPSEQDDHMPVIRQALRTDAQRVLINGLGLGMVVSALMQVPSVTHIDVVEIDADVIALVGEHYQKLAADAGKTLAIHHGDALAISWPRGTAWDLAWHDIWGDMCTDNLEQMAVLHRRYGRRVTWQESWSKQLLIRQRRWENRRGY